MSDIVLDPWLDEAVEAGPRACVQAWLVAEGDHVKPGQTLAHVLAAGVRVELQAAHAGVIEQIHIPAGDSFSPRTVLARLIATS